MSTLPLFQWKPPSKVALFPSTRRVATIKKAAIAAISCRDPEPSIRAAINRTRASHVRKNLDPEVVEVDLLALERAIRSAMAALLARQGRTA